MEYINSCPVCKQIEIEKHLEVEDFFLSHETFNIYICKHCGFLFTQDRPPAAELQKYYQSESYISHSNTKKGMLAFLYQQVRQYTLRRKFSMIESSHKKGVLLDIGCGTGEFLQMGRRRGWTVQGIEPSPVARDFARNKYGLDVSGESELRNLPSGHFDVITLWHVLEHVASLSESIQNLIRILKEDGLLVIAVPNAASKDAAIYKQFWAAYDVPRHLYHFTPSSLRLLLNQQGLEVTGQRPMIFDSFYISLLSEEYRSGKKRLLPAFYHGLISNWWARRNQQNYSSFIFLCKKQKR